MLLRALTNASVVDDDESSDNRLDDNTELVKSGRLIIDSYTKSYIRCYFPKLPEDIVEAAAFAIGNDSALALVGAHLGIDDIVQTKEVPPNERTVSDAVRAIVGAIAAESDMKRAELFILDLILPQLIDMDFCDLYPLADPLAILQDILNAPVESRVLRASGMETAEAVYIVGIYDSQKRLIGQAPGESVSIAEKLAAHDALLSLWGLSQHRRPFVFGIAGHNLVAATPIAFHPTAYLRDLCAPHTNLSLIDLATDTVIDPVDVALHYQDTIEPQLGKPLRRRLRHKFSRGSLHKKSERLIIKPQVYTI